MEKVKADYEAKLREFDLKLDIKKLVEANAVVIMEVKKKRIIFYNFLSLNTLLISYTEQEASLRECLL